MSTHVVTALHLNLRSAADPGKKNVIATLPQGTLVKEIGGSTRPGWIEVEVVVAGKPVRGFLNSAFLGANTTTFPTAQLTGGKLPAADLGSNPNGKRGSTDARAYSIGENGKPSRPSTHASGKAVGIVNILNWLDVGKTSHKRWQGSGGKTFCNVYVYDVCDAVGAYIPRVWWKSKAIGDLQSGKTVTAQYDVTVLEMRANYIFNWLLEYGDDFGWDRVFDVDTLQAGANDGRLGIICAQRTNMETPGHIQIIAPEHGTNTAKRAGGKVTQPLQSNAGASNFTYGFLGAKWWQSSQFKQFGFWLSDVK